jgi:hypothetical protein
MKNVIYILIPLFFIANKLVAQNDLDSLYIKQIDSIRIKINQERYEITHMQYEDTTNNRTIVKSFDSENLVRIFYEHWHCESAIFYLQNDSLICIEYELSDPDVRSLKPPSTTYTIYYKNDQQIHFSKDDNLGGAKTCNEYSLDHKDFLKEFYFYKTGSNLRK